MIIIELKFKIYMFILNTVIVYCPAHIKMQLQFKNMYFLPFFWYCHLTILAGSTDLDPVMSSTQRLYH